MEEASRRFHIPIDWLRAVTRRESDGDPKSVSEKGAIGLMQVMPATYAELRAKYGFGPDPFDPHDNILAGAAYLAEMFGRYGSSGFLAAYNAGPRRYEEHLRGRPLPLETTDYVSRLAPKLGFTSLPRVPMYPAAEPFRAPIFFAAMAQRAPSELIPQGDAGDSWRSRKAAPHPLFPARSDDKIFADEARSASASNDPETVVPLQTADLFVARSAQEASR